MMFHHKTPLVDRSEVTVANMVLDEPKEPFEALIILGNFGRGINLEITVPRVILLDNITTNCTRNIQVSD